MNTHIIVTHILFGYEPPLPLDTFFFENELPLDIYYLNMDHCRTYLIILDMNHEPQLDMDYWTHPIVGHLKPN